MSERIELKLDWTRKQVRQLAANGEVSILQFAAAQEVPPSLLEILNEDLFRDRPDITWRMYGSYARVCDLSCLRLMPHVERLSLDCLTRVSNAHAVEALPKLKEFVFDVYEADSLDVLNAVPTDLQRLRIGKTKTKKTDLFGLERFSHLRQLVVAGHTRGLEVIGKLSTLNEVSLMGMPLSNLAFLRHLPHLHTLQLGFGSAQNLDTLAGLNALRHLALLRIKDLSDLSVVSQLETLQRLTAQDQPHLASLPSLAALEDLALIVLNNVGLKDLRWVASAPALESLAMFQMPALAHGDIQSLLRQPGPLRRLMVGLKSAREHKLARQAIEESGLWDDGGWWR